MEWCKIHSTFNKRLTITMLFDTEISTQNEQIHLSILKDKNIQLFLKREDEIHPFVSGNKFRKLKYNLQEATKNNIHTLLTFGGAYSNHIVATAVAGKMNGFKTVGVIRGDELGMDLEKTLRTNSTLKTAHQYGMKFLFISRSDYQQKSTTEFLKKLHVHFGKFYLIPEGGTNELAIKGCEEILTEKDSYFNIICCAVGTGGTISGLINSAKNHQKIIGFPALKGDFLTHEIRKFTKKNTQWQLEHNYHFGGYAKVNNALIAFINQFKKETNILVDPIYTGKMLFGIVDLILKDTFPENSAIVAIHTGGIQGVDGVNQKLLKKGMDLIDVG